MSCLFSGFAAGYGVLCFAILSQDSSAGQSFEIIRYSIPLTILDDVKRTTVSAAFSFLLVVVVIVLTKICSLHLRLGLLPLDVLI